MGASTPPPPPSRALEVRLGLSAGGTHTHPPCNILATGLDSFNFSSNLQLYLCILLFHRLKNIASLFCHLLTVQNFAAPDMKYKVRYESCNFNQSFTRALLIQPTKSGHIRVTIKSFGQNKLVVLMGCLVEGATHGSCADSGHCVVCIGKMHTLTSCISPPKWAALQQTWG